jgi:hypothetical protein
LEAALQKALFKLPGKGASGSRASTPRASRAAGGGASANSTPERKARAGGQQALRHQGGPPPGIGPQGEEPGDQLQGEPEAMARALQLMGDAALLHHPLDGPRGDSGGAPYRQQQQACAALLPVGPPLLPTVSPSPPHQQEPGFVPDDQAQAWPPLPTQQQQHQEEEARWPTDGALGGCRDAPTKPPLLPPTNAPLFEPSTLSHAWGQLACAPGSIWGYIHTEAQAGALDLGYPPGLTSEPLLGPGDPITELRSMAAAMSAPYNREASPELPEQQQQLQQQPGRAAALQQEWMGADSMALDTMQQAMSSGSLLVSPANANTQQQAGSLDPSGEREAPANPPGLLPQWPASGGPSAQYARRPLTAGSDPPGLGGMAAAGGDDWERPGTASAGAAPAPNMLQCRHPGGQQQQAAGGPSMLPSSPGWEQEVLLMSASQAPPTMDAITSAAASSYNEGAIATAAVAAAARFAGLSQHQTLQLVTGSQLQHQQVFSSQLQHQQARSRVAPPRLHGYQPAAPLHQHQLQHLHQHQHQMQLQHQMLAAPGTLMGPVTMQHHARASSQGGYAIWGPPGMLANPPGLIPSHAMPRGVARQPPPPPPQQQQQQQHALGQVRYHYHPMAMHQAHQAPQQVQMQQVVYVVQHQVPGPPGLKHARY